MSPQRLLLLSEAALAGKQSGLSRMLSNLLDSYPRDRLLVASPERAEVRRDAEGPGDPDFRRCYFRSEVVSSPRNRIGLAMEPAIAWLNRAILRQAGRLPPEALRFAPESILLCTNLLPCFEAAERFADKLGCRLYIFAMDDWIGIERKPLIGSGAKALFRRLIDRAAGVIAISAPLLAELSRRYPSLSSKRALVLPNAVDTAGKQFQPLPAEGPFKLAYAGAIWGMHRDALETVARAVFDLRKRGLQIELELFTPPEFWSQREELWRSLEVSYGGFLDYGELCARLPRAHMLVAASSFAAEYRELSAGSLQSKLIDYIAAGRAVLSCGPAYAVAHSFVREHACGIAHEDADSHKLADRLALLIIDRAALERLGRAGLEAARSGFDKRLAAAKLRDFLSC